MWYLNEGCSSLEWVVYWDVFYKVVYKYFCCRFLWMNRGVLVSNLILGCWEFDILTQEFYFIVTFKVFGQNFAIR